MKSMSLNLAEISRSKISQPWVPYSTGMTQHLALSAYSSHLLCHQSSVGPPAQHAAIHQLVRKGCGGLDGWDVHKVDWLVDVVVLPTCDLFLVWKHQTHDPKLSLFLFFLSSALLSFLLSVCLRTFFLLSCFSLLLVFSFYSFFLLFLLFFPSFFVFVWLPPVLTQTV